MRNEFPFIQSYDHSWCAKITFSSPLKYFFLKSRGVHPYNFLKTLLKFVDELNPSSLQIWPMGILFSTSNTQALPILYSFKN